MSHRPLAQELQEAERMRRLLDPARDWSRPTGAVPGVEEELARMRARANALKHPLQEQPVLTMEGFGYAGPSLLVNVPDSFHPPADQSAADHEMRGPQNHSRQDSSSRPMPDTGSRRRAAALGLAFALSRAGQAVLELFREALLRADPGMGLNRRQAMDMGRDLGRDQEQYASSPSPRP